jgi:hypothetical protein
VGIVSLEDLFVRATGTHLHGEGLDANELVVTYAALAPHSPHSPR